MTEPTDQHEPEISLQTDAQRFEEGVKTLFRAPKKAVMERIEAEKQERKRKQTVKPK